MDSVPAPGLAVPQSVDSIVLCFRVGKVFDKSAGHARMHNSILHAGIAQLVERYLAKV